MKKFISLLGIDPMNLEPFQVLAGDYELISSHHSNCWSHIMFDAEQLKNTLKKVSTKVSESKEPLQNEKQLSFNGGVFFSQSSSGSISSSTSAQEVLKS